MVSKSGLQQFTESWDQTAAWAQSQGIPRKDYYPIYQMDSARFLAPNSTPMSQAERTRAILAAANPNNVTAVPGAKPDPANIWGNTFNDLTNIFTGLAPNHLVSNIFDSVKNAIIHPASIIKPIGQILGGAATGNWTEVGQGFEAAAGLNGQNSILSWLPGVYVAGEFAQGGINEVLSHPVVSFLDVAPFAPAGRIIDIAANESRVATMAGRLGMTSDELAQKSLPALGAAWALNTKVAGLPDFLSSRAPALVDANGNPLTIGGAIDNWIRDHTGLGKTLAAVMKGMLVVNQEKTDAELALYRPAQLSLRGLNDDELNQVWSSIYGMNPETKGKTQAEIRADGNIEEKVRTAIDLNMEPLYYVREMSVASGATVPVARADGSIAFVHTAGEKSIVADSAKELAGARDDLIRDMGPSHRLSQESHQLDLAGQALQTRIDRTAQQAEKDVAALDGSQRFENLPTEAGKKRPRVVTLDLRKQARELFGTDEKSRNQGLVYQAEQAMMDRDWATVKVLSAGVMRRLERSGVGSLDADLAPSLGELKAQMNMVHEWASRRVEFDRRFTAEFEKDGKFGRVRGSLDRYLSAERKFANVVRAHPTGEWVDVAKDLFIKNLLDQEDSYHRMEDFAKGLARRGVGQDRIDRLRQDPVKFAQLMVVSIRALGNNPFGDQILKPAEEQAMWRSAITEADKLRQSGQVVQWVPRITSLDLRDEDPGRFGIHVASSGKARRSTRAFARKLDLTPERHDVVAALHQAGKEQLQIDGTIEYMERVLEPHMASGSQMLDQILKGGTGLDQVYEHYLAQGSNATDAIERIMKENFKMQRFDAQGTFGFTLPRWTNDPYGQYIPEGIARALPKMLDRGQFPVEAVYDKATQLFRFSILKMSPRYTAHVLFGGTFLLALRSSPALVKAIPEAYRIMKDKGEIPRSTFERSATTQFGVQPVQYLSYDDNLRNISSQAYHYANGGQLAKWASEENIEKVQKVPLREAKPVHWLKALGEVNYKFTNWIGSFQRAAAYIDYLGGAEKKMFRDPVDGDTIAMTKDRAHQAAMEHVYRTLGDLQAMSPLEKAVFTNIMPFYGWTRHILGYVGTYPVDHPFRAGALAVMAEQNSDAVASGLPTRIQLLAFLGSPDQQGNVTAVDVRSLDPLRDVANYMTLGGWVSALNPVITAPIAMIDPNILFGGTTLYPNLTYNAFYGIETASAQGSPLTAIEQVVPQVTALQAALQTSGQFKQLAATNPNAFAKTIFEALNVPFAQVQHLNLKQIAAKDEIDRYQVAKQAATNAFDSGDFSAISGLSSVPDPLNSDWNIAPGSLQALYNQLLTEYPGTPPSETALPPPSAPL